jgi:hypothetical protein
LQFALSHSLTHIKGDVKVDLINVPDDYQEIWKDSDCTSMITSAYQAYGMKRSADFTEVQTYCELLFQALLASIESVEENSIPFLKFFIEFFRNSFERMFETPNANKPLLKSILKNSLEVIAKLQKLPKSPKLVEELKEILT